MNYYLDISLRDYLSWMQFCKTYAGGEPPHKIKITGAKSLDKIEDYDKKHIKMFFKNTCVLDIRSTDDLGHFLESNAKIQDLKKLQLSHYVNNILKIENDYFPVKYYGFNHDFRLVLI